MVSLAASLKTLCTLCTSGRRAAGGELALERLPLVRAEAADATAGRNAELLHDALRAHLADARHRLENSRHPHLADDLVGLTRGEDVRERCARVLQLVAQLSPGLPRRGGFLERGGSLLGSERRKG